MKGFAKGYGGGTNEQKIKTSPSCLPGLPPYTNSSDTTNLGGWQAVNHSDQEKKLWHKTAKCRTFTVQVMDSSVLSFPHLSNESHIWKL